MQTALLRALAKVLAATKGDQTFELGDGYVVRLEPHPLGTDCDSWRFYSDRSPDSIGYITVYTNYDTGPAVGDIKLDKDSRGMGLARKALPQLVKHYGSLTSDPQGNTSDAAAKMWVALRAKEVPSDKCIKGWMFRLED